ncbi:hypothetical protein RUM4293_04363 [Ruegeria atlantica]|uniref:Uncharacterized protein n=1 Tax=Ruegeria atlantica TaxID=81569 RepID=A0A0P1EX92_9RHOB|nr:hypothetical protein RUM4293_04363 [Ruegeria atlantica]
MSYRPLSGIGGTQSLPGAIQRLGAVGRHAAGGAAILCGAAPDFKRFAAPITQPGAFACVLFVLQALLLVSRFFFAAWPPRAIGLYPRHLWAGPHRLAVAPGWRRLWCSNTGGCSHRAWPVPCAVFATANLASSGTRGAGVARAINKPGCRPVAFPHTQRIVRGV